MAISDWFKTPESDETDLFRKSRPSKAEREEMKRYSRLPMFPWESSMAELNVQHSQIVRESPDAMSEERQIQGRMFGQYTTLFKVADLGVSDPLSGSLFVRPLEFVEPSLDNSRLIDVKRELLKMYEDNEVDSWPILLLEGHIKSTSSPVAHAIFRPSGDGDHYPIFGNLTGTFDSRLVILARLIVIEGQRGPELTLECLKSESCDEYFSSIYRKIDGRSLSDSTYFFEVLDFAFYNFSFPNVSFESLALFEDDFDYLTRRTNIVEDAVSSEWKEREARFADLVFAAIPDTELPGVRLPGGRQAVVQGSGVTKTLPAPRLIKTPRDAELYAAEVMEASGFSNVALTGLSADGGVDVEATEAVAQVKLEGRPSSREQLQRLYGIAAHRDVLALFFSLGGYSSPAIEWAEETGMLLFEFEFDGTISPRSPMGEKLFGGY